MSHMRHICAASVLILIPRPRYQPKSKAVHIIVYTCLCSHRIPCPTCSTYVPQIIPRPEYQPKREARALVNHDTLYGRAGPCSTLQCTYLSCPEEPILDEGEQGKDGEGDEKGKGKRGGRGTKRGRAVGKGRGQGGRYVLFCELFIL
jgi:hypothetical protein